MLTLEILAEIMPHARNPAEHVDPLNSAMREFDISTIYQQGMFIGQIAHETGELQWMEELASGKEYENRTDLGNSNPGDGIRYKGRGYFQITGRYNYKNYGHTLGVDLVDNPEQAAIPAIAARVAGLFWKNHNLNVPADAQNITAVTRTINGGLNGLLDRLHYYHVAIAVLSREQPITPITVKVVVNGSPVGLDNDCFWRSGHIYLPLRKLADLIGWGILAADNNIAIIRDKDGGNQQLPFITENNIGYINAHDLAGLARWESATNTLYIG